MIVVVVVVVVVVVEGLVHLSIVHAQFSPSHMPSYDTVESPLLHMLGVGPFMHQPHTPRTTQLEHDVALEHGSEGRHSPFLQTSPAPQGVPSTTLLHESVLCVASHTWQLLSGFCVFWL